MFKTVKILFVVLFPVIVTFISQTAFGAARASSETAGLVGSPDLLVGSSVPVGIEQLKTHVKLKMGDVVLTTIPREKQEALAVARFCKENKIHVCYPEFLYRGTYDVAWMYREHMPREQFYSKADIDEIIDAAGEYYLGRFTIGEIGGLLYWPKEYSINRRAKAFESLPACDTVNQAQDAFVAECKRWLDYERAELGKGPLMCVDSSLVFKYLVMAGIDVLNLEVMPGDPHIMHAAIRGAARAYDKQWGTHIAMQSYGGMCFDELYQKRWRTAVFYSYITGANFIWPENGHYDYANRARRQKFDFHSQEMKRVRSVIREAWQFARINKRPPGGPKTTFAVVHGKYDGTPGLWNRYAWGQYYDDKWLEGPAERGWRSVDKFHRKEEWPKETVQGSEDFSGNPPYGQYDIVPIEAPLEVLQKYTSLVFLGWNTMTSEIYEKLKDYVKTGGHLVMFLPHLSTHTDRADDLKLFGDGDFSDLFGLKVIGRGKKDVIGVKCMADSTLKSYRFPLWRIRTDPRFMGNMTPARLEITTGRIISAWSDFYYVTEEEMRAQPILVENSLGKGKAFLITAWEYPGDEGMVRFTDDILRVVLQGEQGDIRLLASDRIRYAVYEDKLPHSDIGYSLVYLLNTDPDCNVLARLRVDGRTTQEFIVSANDIRIAYRCGGVVLVPQDKCVDIKSWKAAAEGHKVELFSARDQKIEVHNVGQDNLSVSINGSGCICEPGGRKLVSLNKHIDPKRKEFFASDFLEEPRVEYIKGKAPY